jgi:hypothetical protein
MYSVTVKKFGSEETINKQVRFATALALTRTAKQAQSAVITRLDDNFELRTNWSQPSNRVGIRITPAKKDNLEAQVKTQAVFLNKFDTGDDKLPLGKYIAIPTANVRRNKRQLIVKNQRPRNLKRSFIIVTSKKKTAVLFQRVGKNKRSAIRAMYILVPRAEIDRQPSFRQPIETTVRANFNRNFEAAMKEAFATAR